jgi:heterodisulfide reductase subunit A-like polyferredoxin
MNFPRLGNLATIMAFLGNNTFIEKKDKIKTNFIVEKDIEKPKGKGKDDWYKKQQKENRKKYMKRKKRRGY